MNAGVYVIENTSTGQVYVGSSKKLSARWQVHRSALRRGKHHASRLQEAYDRLGAEAIVFKPVVYCAPDNLLMYEQIAMDAFRAASNGYNNHPRAGSPKGWRHSPESRAKLSASLLASGRVYGPPSEETRQKIGAASKGRTASPETREKMRRAQTGRQNTPEAIENMRRAQSVRKPLTEDQRARMSEAAKRRFARESAAGIERQFSPAFIEQQGRREARSS